MMLQMKMVNRLILGAIVMALMLQLNSAPVLADNVPVRGVDLVDREFSLQVGNKRTLVANVRPNFAKNTSVTWSSSNRSIASVDKNGVVTALNPGIAIITVQTNDGNFRASAKVTVRPFEGVNRFEFHYVFGTNIPYGFEVKLNNDITKKIIDGQNVVSNLTVFIPDPKISAVVNGFLKSSRELIKNAAKKERGIELKFLLPGIFRGIDSQ